MIAAPRQAPRTDVILLVTLYAAEFFLLLMALAIHRLGDRPIASSVASAPGIAFVAALAIVVAACVLIVRRYVRARRSGSREFGFTVAMNLITLALIFIPVEIAVRVLSRSTSDTAVLFNTMLLPRSWEKAAADNRQLFDKASGVLSYLVYDEMLGWTVGPNRSGGNGMYRSSAEGLRAASQGAVLAGPKTRRRVAILGDSFAFAERVAFEDSWGQMLERSSGQRIEVLNFGVGGYSIDQAYLRFKTDVLAWKPDVAILGFPLSDVHRTVTVYPFISWPEWQMPYSKPRIVRDGDALKILNVPTIAPAAIFAYSSIADLPLLEYDAGYKPRDWQRSFTDASYAKRLLFSVFAPHSEPGPHVSDQELVRVNAAILQEFIRRADENGIVPMLAYFPGQPEILRLARGEQSPGHRLMKEIGLPYVDTTPCVMEIGPDEGFVPGDPHYSARGNAAVAKCIGPALDKILEQRAVEQATSNQRQ